MGWRIDNTGLEPGTHVIVTGGPHKGMRGVIGSEPATFADLGTTMEAQFRVIGIGAYSYSSSCKVLVRWLRPLSAVDRLAEQARRMDYGLAPLKGVEPEHE